jgi:uncharacterized membrane protein (DUF373 family)
MNTDPISQNSAYQTFVVSNKLHSKIIGFLIGILMIAIYLWMASGFVNLLVNLFHAYPDNWSNGAEEMIKETVIILASFELIRVFQSYLLLGRVKVTFILDVALVVLIGELISLWYAEFTTREVMLSIFVITALIALRITTAKFSPDELSEPSDNGLPKDN